MPCRDLIGGGVVRRKLHITHTHTAGIVNFQRKQLIDDSLMSPTDINLIKKSGSGTL